jgi:hypothetical protein
VETTPALRVDTAGVMSKEDGHVELVRRLASRGFTP